MFSSLEEDDETREEISANAKLITAAPDLLKTNIKMTTVVASCIDILSLYIIPNGISEKTAIEQLIGILDNAEIMKSIRLSNLAIDKATFETHQQHIIHRIYRNDRMWCE
jgi:hypothetical protein